MGDANEPGGTRLDSWKAIADYLHRDAATLRRWEKTLGLPIRRVPGGRGRSVFAYTSEIDAWLLAAKPPADAAQTSGAAPPGRPALGAVAADALPSRFTPARVAVAAAAVVIVAAILVGVRFRTVVAAGGDLNVTVSAEGVVARDLRGAERWRHPFAANYKTELPSVALPLHMGGGVDPAVFVATSHRYRKADGIIEGGELLWLSPNGEARRSFAFDDRLVFGGETFGPPWAITAFAIDDSGPRRRVAVAAHHYEWSPSVVAVLDDRFQRLATYAQAGWIEDVRWLGANRLLLAGFNQTRDGGMIALIDPSIRAAQAPADAGTRYQCESCGDGLPLKIVVMPRTEINRTTASRFNRARIELFPDRIVARTEEAQSSGDPPEALFAPRILDRAGFAERLLQRGVPIAPRRAARKARAGARSSRGPRPRRPARRDGLGAGHRMADRLRRPSRGGAKVRTAMRLAAVLLIASTAGADSAAQTFVATVRGRVRDAGGGVASAGVQLIDEATGIVSTTTTNERGEYDVADVAPGAYASVSRSPATRRTSARLYASIRWRH